MALAIDRENCKENVISINTELCGRCGICYSVCPFDTIKRDKKTNGYKIEIEKCQVCGICAGACPASAINILYYNEKSLIQYIAKQMQVQNVKALVVICRNIKPLSQEIIENLKKNNIKKYIDLQLPCVGRISADFYLDTFKCGIDKIVILQCEENFCRYNTGSKINLRKILMSQALIKQFNLEKSKLTFLKSSKKIYYDADKCIGCDKCEYVCPHDAIKVQPLSTPEIDFSICDGCGACSNVCPYLSLQLEGNEHEFISKKINNYHKKINEYKKSNIKPLVLVFCCKWAEFSVLDRVEDGIFRKNVFIIKIPCVNSLDPSLVIEGLMAGFDGVLLVACPEDDCKHQEGRDTANRDIASLHKIIKNIYHQKKLKFIENSPRNIKSFEEQLDEFIKELK